MTAFRGDSSWTGYHLISGRWFTGPGQASDIAEHAALRADVTGPWPPYSFADGQEL